MAKADQTEEFDCQDLEEGECVAEQNCEWKYNGQGSDFQFLVGPAFIYTFSTSALVMGFALDKFNRPIIMSVGIMVFSISCILMGIANAFWQLIVLRMGIALGEAVCRPAASSLIAEVFSPDNRGVANGIFSWGVYFWVRYGLHLWYIPFRSRCARVRMEGSICDRRSSWCSHINSNLLYSQRSKKKEGGREN